MRRFVRESADAAIVSSRSALRAIAATRIAPPRVGRRRGAHRSGPHANAIDAAWKGASIIVITSARTAPA
jgi:hypothetical protein